MRFTKRIQDLPTNKNGERQLEPHHLDDNFAAQDDALLTTLGALFAAGGVAVPGTVTLTALALRVQGRTGVTLDGRVPLHVDDQTLDLTPLAAGKGLVLMTTDPVTIQRPYTDVVTGESLTDTMNLSAGRLSVIGAGQQGVTLDAGGYPVAPSNTMPVAQVTRTAGGATLDSIPNPALTIRAGVGSSGVVSVNNKAGVVTLTPADIGAASAADLAAKADLVAGKLAFSQLPSLAYGERFTVATQAAMLALTAQIDDIAVRTDVLNHRFLLTGNPATLADWIDLDAGSSTGGAVSSVNGFTGNVVLGAGDVGAIPASQKGAVNGVATLGPDGLLLPSQRPPNSAGGAINLSTPAAPGVVLSARAPITTASSNFGERTYGVFTPTQDALVSGLRDTVQALNMPCMPYIFRISDGALIASGPAVSRTGASADYLFTGPVTLVTGVAYAIGIDTPAGTTPASLGRVANNQTGTYPGFTVEVNMRYGGAPGTLPPTTFVSNAYSPSWNILTPGVAGQKSVTGPLDPLDFPVVKTVADLPVNAVALLDPGTSAPRLIRKRADGTVWYGTLFTSVP